MEVLEAAERLLFVNRALIMVLEEEEAAAQRRIARLEGEVGGPGRGHGARGPQRHFPAVDCYGNCVAQGDHAFYTYTRFSQQEFDALLAELSDLILANRHVRMNVPEPSGEQRKRKATVQNRLLLALKFLTCGGSCAQLGVDFGLSEHVVSEDLLHVVFAILQGIAYEIRFPSPGPETDARRGTVSSLYPRAIALVDMTYTPAPRRHGDFSGHRWQPIRAHQLVMDSLGFVLHVSAGLAGAQHDSFHYRNSELPDLLAAVDADLLGDDAYVGMPHIRTPPTAAEFPNPAELKSAQEEFVSKRSRIEQFFSVLKAWFTVAGRKWQRHDRHFLACCFVASCLLYNRRKRLNAAL